LQYKLLRVKKTGADLPQGCGMVLNTSRNTSERVSLDPENKKPLNDSLGGFFVYKN
jgi:hypothetical protein